MTNSPPARDTVEYLRMVLANILLGEETNTFTEGYATCIRNLEDFFEAEGVDTTELIPR